MIKSENMNVTIETDSMLNTFIETTLLVHAVKDALADEVGEDKAHRLISRIGVLATFDEDTLCEVLAELIGMMKGKKYDS